MTSINIVSTAQRLYQCREQQIFLSGEQGFIEKYEKWSPVIRLTMAKFNCNELHALVRILEITEKRHDSGMFTHQRPTYHEIRSLAARMIEEKGLSATKRMAHSNSKTTEIYTKPDQAVWNECEPISVKEYPNDN